MTSTRLPCTLLYLTIFNPTLRPSAHTDDEDAEEQSQILFYTSKERAVSRDKMLRQVGLAKALITFAQMFNTGGEEQCDNVHSQNRRMVMISPEPDFWIHAAVELARSPKPKSKDPSSYDTHESSVHDIALRAELQLAYEQFKLRYGSFQSLLRRVGQEGLELELERYFTVWAWSGFSGRNTFGNHLGIPMHPQYETLNSTLDAIGGAGIIVTPTHMVPSKVYSERGYPSALARFLASLIHPPAPPPPSSAADAPKEDEGPAEVDKAGTFLGIPSSSGVNMSSMDVRKWNWTGYLTFGKNKHPASSHLPLPPDTSVPTTKEGEPDALPAAKEEDIDPVSTAKEGSADPVPTAKEEEDPVTTPTAAAPEPGKEAEEEETVLDKVALEEAMSDNISFQSSAQDVSEDVSQEAPVQWLSTRIFINDDGEASKVVFVVDYPVLLALIDVQSPDEWSHEATRVLKQVKEAMSIVPEETTIPSVNKLLTTKDHCIVSAPPYTWSEDPFVSDSIHLFNAQSLLTSRLGIEEVHSRGQNPQYWHVGTRAGGEERQEYAEVFRKEASLTDVENTLTSLVKRTVKV